MHVNKKLDAQSAALEAKLDAEEAAKGAWSVGSSAVGSRTVNSISGVASGSLEGEFDSFLGL